MTTTETTWQHFSVEHDAEGIAWVIFDRADAKANSLNGAVIAELQRLVEALEGLQPRGVVFRSGKRNGFIAGADIREFVALEDERQALGLIRTGQGVMDRIAGLPFPTVAMIHGFCLGGGMELALACDYRVADDASATRLGLPEVQLGIHPGFGGSARLPALIGHVPAMNLMLTGRTLSAKAAAKQGVIDHAVPTRHLERAARMMIRSRPDLRRPGMMQRLPGWWPLAAYTGRAMRKRVAKKAPAEHYPAPHALIDVWQKGVRSHHRWMGLEADSVARLIVTPTARQLVRLFFLRERLKGFGRRGGGGFKRLHVIGAGVMGGDIAAWCALRGLTVTLQDLEVKSIAGALKRARGLFRKKLRHPRKVQAAMDRLRPDPEGFGVAGADVVIEAVAEKLSIKQSLFKSLETRVKPEAILATNTSSLPLEEIGAVLERPERLIGLHFFNPVAKMPLLEVVSCPATDSEVLARGFAFANAIGRLPLPVKSAPGFLVNRVLMPYLLEAVTMNGEGISTLHIDTVARRFGMPMGPLELADTVGLDICLSVAEVLGDHFGKPVPEALRRLVEAGHLGRKSGRGFYHHHGGRKRPTPVVTGGCLPERTEVRDRLITPFINESLACLREGIVADADLLDAGVVFGTGFAPFRGGPMSYLAHEGVEDVQQRMQRLQQTCGARFSADAGWGDGAILKSLEGLSDHAAATS
ncbi:MAG: enoyl-CoA hydratase/isomerase family protein [Magnetococcales bacterium]|nr:enoyl-CoA hydratase/isomerase family protein [Magnetococcales bacterium]